MMRIVVLGPSGMLGSMIVHYLRGTGKFDVLPCPGISADHLVRGEPLPQLRPDDVVINCIGVIKPFCKPADPVGVPRAIRVNALFPHVLAHEVHSAGARLIQIATDCVYAGTIGAYAEAALHDATDVYGKTKSLGEPFTPGVLNIRCSLVGPEANGRNSQLLEWFLSQPAGEGVDGYAHHRWNGVTTLQFARLCERLAGDPKVLQTAIDISSLHHFVPNEIVTKYELLKLFAEIFEHPIEVRYVDAAGEPIDRSLSTSRAFLSDVFPAESQRSALRELQAYTAAFRADTRSDVEFPAESLALLSSMI